MSAFPSAHQANSLPSVIDSPSHEPRFLKNHGGQTGWDIPQCVHIQNALPVQLDTVLSGLPLLSSAGESTRLHLLFHAALCCVMAEAAGRDCLQQINISTHVSGPCAHRSGWKLLQSFLRRRETVPKPAWGEWNGPEQWHNWGALGWGLGWRVSLHGSLLASSSRRWPLGLETPTAGAFSHPQDTDVTSFSSRIAHVLQTSHMREHTLVHHCVCVCALFAWVCLSVCVCAFHSGRVSASARTAHIMTQSELVSFCRAELEKAKRMCVRVCLSVGYKLHF